MATQREVLEAAARCMAVMVHYHNGARTKLARQVLVDEVQALAGWADAAGLDAEAKRVGIVEPVQVGLLLRYTDVEAGRLFGEFVAAFEGGGGLMLRKA